MLDNWLLTGIPRSGTSLCCRLAGQLPNTVALSEPLPPDLFDGAKDTDDIRKRINDFVVQIRAKILQERRAPSLTINGHLYDNIVTPTLNGEGLRRVEGRRGAIVVEKPLSDRFTLIVRHNAMFAALLPVLKVSFSYVALVRNPLAVLASWQTVDLPVHHGRLPGAEPFAADLCRDLEHEPDRFRRQVRILNWFFAHYRAHLPSAKIIRYEDLVDTNGSALARVLGHVSIETEPLDNLNDNVFYDKTTVAALLDALLDEGGSWSHFYTRGECEQIAKAIGGLNHDDRCR